MILCICQSVTDREVDAAIQDGAQTVTAVAQACGAGLECGCCRWSIAERISRACTGDCSNCPGGQPELASAVLGRECA